MSDTEGHDQTPDESTPPYPGWSPEQPQQHAQQPGWTQPGQPTGGWGTPQSPQQPGWGTPGQQQPPNQPPTPPPAPPPGPGAQQWNQPSAPASSWSTWRPPDPKPGVIPLRPLGVGEILDGAVTTIRKNLGAMLGLSAVVAVIVEVVSLGLIWFLIGDFFTGELLGPGMYIDPESVDSFVGKAFTAAGISLVIGVLAMTFLAGMLTVVVGRAVLGEHITVAQAWAMTKGRLPRLLGLLLLYTLIWAGPLIAGTLLALLFAVGGSDAGAGGMALLTVLVAVPLSIWLYVRFALSTPSLMLETTDVENGGSRPVTVMESLRRSSQLVKKSWWRMFGILILVTLIVWIVSSVVAVPFAIPSIVAEGGLDEPPTFISLTAGALGNIIATTLTAPFSAAATALLYIDRRIRREGLDLDLARAAGVELPGRYTTGGQH